MSSIATNQPNSRLRSNLVGLQTIVIKEVTRLLRIWPQTIVPPVITTTLYYIIFGKVIGSRIETVGEVPYMEFVVPGLVVMSVINNSYTNVVSSFFSSKFQRNVEEMLVSPMHNSVILVGYMAGGIARAMMIGFIVLLVSMFFVGSLSIDNVLLTIAVAFLTATLFSIGGFVNAPLARKFDDVAIIPTFVLTPLTYLSGIFYPISWLGETWQTVSRFNPMFYMVGAFREAILGNRIENEFSIGIATVAISAFIAAAFLLTLWMLHRGVGLRA